MPKRKSTCQRIWGRFRFTNPPLHQDLGRLRLGLPAERSEGDGRAARHAVVPGIRRQRVFVGSPGVGKSHLSIALGYEAVLAHGQVYFADCSKLAGGLLHAYAKETLSRRLRLYEHCGLLIIDEPGYLDMGKEGADLLFQLGNRRYVLGRSTIVTTNVPAGRWGRVPEQRDGQRGSGPSVPPHCTLVKRTSGPTG